MWAITDKLFLGDRDDARDQDLLQRHRITHVLNCAADEPCHFLSNLQYLHLALQDPDPRFGDLIPTACDFIDRGIDSGGVLVHCSAGVSRSAAVVLAWLCCRSEPASGAEPPLLRAARRLRARVLTNPDPLFLEQLARHLGTPIDKSRVRCLSDLLLGHESDSQA